MTMPIYPADVLVQSRHADRGPRRKGRLHMAVLYRRKAVDVRGEVGVKGGDVDHIVPARHLARQRRGDMRKGALIPGRQIALSLRRPRDHPRQVNGVARDHRSRIADRLLKRPRLGIFGHQDVRGVARHCRRRQEPRCKNGDGARHLL